MSYTRTLENISERSFFGQLLTLFKPPIRISTIEWAKKYRVMSSTETSVGVGTFDPNVTPYMEYVYDCLDNPSIPDITSMKSAQIGWSEVTFNWLGSSIHVKPSNMLLAFPIKTAAALFAKDRWKPFIQNTPILQTLINVGVAKNKESAFYYMFPNGSLIVDTAGSIATQKSKAYPKMLFEEPDDMKDNIAGQGDTFSNFRERQKTIPDKMRKFIFGGTPTNKDFSRVEKAFKQSNQLIFKAECHECKELVAMDGSGFTNLFYDEFQDRVIDEIYGKCNPKSAYYLCPFCQADWTFEQKNINIVNGKKYGFTDHTGNFSKGWHPNKPKITDIFGFGFSELMSPFLSSSFANLAKAKILADLDCAMGNEASLKSFHNNKMGLPYASGFSSLEAEEMVQLRSNYPEGIAPMEGLVPFIGIDVQHNRFAVVTLVAGRNGCTWLVKWEEIFGNVFNWEDPVWDKLTNIILEGIPHVTGKQLAIEATSIDSGDGQTVELVYRWVKMMNDKHGKTVLATKGTRELKYSTDEIYREPRDTEVVNALQHRRTMAETMGVPVYPLGSHRAHDEILRRVILNKNPDNKHDVFYFNDTSYGSFEEQMTSCRKLIDTTSNSQKEVYKLITGKRKEAIDCCKNALHAMFYRRIREFTEAHWVAIESWLETK